MDPDAVGLVLLGVLGTIFAIANGANDGAVLLAAALKLHPVRMVLAAGVAIALLVLAPLLLGPRVAETFARRLVDFEADGGRSGAVVALAACLIVVAILSRLKLPTSLTLAIIGGITGAGLGGGLPVAWSLVGLVLLFAVLAPIAGVILGWSYFRLASAWRYPAPVGRTLLVAHAIGFALLALAYGANDGQKVLGILLVISEVTGTTAALPGPSLVVPALVAAALFAIGLPLGMVWFVRTIAYGLATVRPANAVVAEFACSTAVLCTGLLGFPVSLSQTMAGALMGSNAAESPSRIRWQVATHLGIAWLLTLPGALLVAVGLSRVADLLVGQL